MKLLTLLLCHYIIQIERLIDLLKVSQQVTQNLAQRVRNTHGFYISPIFLTFPREDGRTNAPHDDLDTRYLFICVFP